MVAKKPSMWANHCTSCPHVQGTDSMNEEGQCWVTKMQARIQRAHLEVNNVKFNMLILFTLLWLTLCAMYKNHLGSHIHMLFGCSYVLQYSAYAPEYNNFSLLRQTPQDPIKSRLPLPLSPTNNNKNHHTTKLRSNNLCSSENGLNQKEKLNFCICSVLHQNFGMSIEHKQVKGYG